MRALKNTVTVSLAVLTLALGLAAGKADAKPMFAHGHGGFWGPAAAIGLIGGVVAGSALAAAQPVYPAGYGVYAEPAPTCYFARQPVVDGWGNLISYRRVRVCE